MLGNSRHQTQKQTNVGLTWQRGLQHRHVNGTPPMLSRVHCEKRATRVSDLVFFNHQYITNPQVTPETLVLKAAAELTGTLKHTVLRELETADALSKGSKLFAKIAEARAAAANAREQQNTLRTHPTACRAVPHPRVELPMAPPPRVQNPQTDDCRISDDCTGTQITSSPPDHNGQIPQCAIKFHNHRIQQA